MNLIVISLIIYASLNIDEQVDVMTNISIPSLPFVPLRFLLSIFICEYEIVISNISRKTFFVSFKVFHLPVLLSTSEFTGEHFCIIFLIFRSYRINSISFPFVVEPSTFVAFWFVVSKLDNKNLRTTLPTCHSIFVQLALISPVNCITVV